MVIGEGQSVGGDKASRAAVVKPHRAQPNVIQPLLGHLESIFCFYFLLGKGVEKPHSFVCTAYRTERKKAQEEDREKGALHGTAPGTYESSERTARPAY